MYNIHLSGDDLLWCGEEIKYNVWWAIKLMSHPARRTSVDISFFKSCLLVAFEFFHIKFKQHALCHRRCQSSSLLIMQRCCWTPAGLGVHPLPARQCASCRKQGYPCPSWWSALSAACVSAPPATLTGTQDMCARGPSLSSPPFRRTGKLLIRKCPHIHSNSRNKDRHLCCCFFFTLVSLQFKWHKSCNWKMFNCVPVSSHRHATLFCFGC